MQKGSLAVFFAAFASVSCASLALADALPIPEGGKELEPGQVPEVCPADPTLDFYSVNYGYYYSENADTWVSAPYCYPLWGNLVTSGSGVVESGKPITVTAVPTDGSNSDQYAPETKSIAWIYPGTLVSGCGNADLACTVIPTDEATTEWQWFEFKVTMPRTFFIDSPGELCAGQHLCAGVATNAWAVVGVAPEGAGGGSGGDGNSDADGGCAVTNHSSPTIASLILVCAALVHRRSRRRSAST